LAKLIMFRWWGGGARELSLRGALF